MFMAAKLPAKEAKISQLKEEKKVRLTKMAKEEIAIKILSLAKTISSISVFEPIALLQWHNQQKDDKLGEKRKQWEKIVMSGAAPPSYFNLTEDDEIALHKLEAKPTCIKETDHCRMKEQHKKEICNIQSIVKRGDGGFYQKD